MYRLTPTFFFSLCFTYLINQSAGAALPPDAESALKKVPDQALTLPLIVGQAMKYSDSFRSVSANAIAVRASRWGARAPLDYYLELNGFYSDNRNEPNSPFGTERVVSDGFSLGFSTLFRTGTTLRASYELGFQDLTFGGAFAGGGNEFHNSAIVLTAQQSLWKNFFGYATRADLEAGDKGSEAAELQLQSDIEQWFLDLSNQFYTAWLLQANVAAAKRSLDRQRRLEKITKIRRDRGTSVEPEYLQVAAARLLAENTLSQASQDLADLWRSLVITLQLPKEWLNIDPTEIPIRLRASTDQTLERAIEACGNPDSIKPAPDSPDAATRAAIAAAERAAAHSRARSNEMNPDLNLEIQVGTNGVDQNGFGDAFSEMTQVNNNAWRVAVNFKMPLALYDARSRASQAAADRIRAEANASLGTSNFGIAWLNECKSLFRLKASVEANRVRFEQQSKRARLEEERFEIGRTGVLQTVQAAADLDVADIDLRLGERDLMLSAWRIMRYQSRIKDFLSDVTLLKIDLNGDSQT